MEETPPPLKISRNIFNVSPSTPSSIGKRKLFNTESPLNIKTRSTILEKDEPTGINSCVLPNTVLCPNAPPTDKIPKISKIISDPAELKSLIDATILAKRVDPEMKTFIYPNIEESCLIDINDNGTYPILMHYGLPDVVNKIVQQCPITLEPPFGVFTMVQGIPITDYIKSINKEEDKISLYRAVVQCFISLNKFHSADIIHGDVNIGNLVVFSNPLVVKLIDFNPFTKLAVSDKGVEKERMKDTLFYILKSLMLHRIVKEKRPSLNTLLNLEFKLNLPLI